MSDVAPLTPPDCDLRGLPFMPLDVVRIIDSDLFALSTGEEFKAALALWCKAWLQVPAASLPDDDRVLAHLSGAGLRWKKVKKIALRGWILCHDGRFYHPVVAEKANDAWERRGEWQEKQTNKSERQARWREHVKTVSSELRSLGVTPPTNASLKELERLLVDAKASTKASTGASTVDAAEAAKTGTGTGTEEKIPPNPRKLPDDVNAIMAAGDYVSPPGDLRLLQDWYAAGATLDQDILPCIRRVRPTLRKAPFTLKVFDPYIREKLAADAAEIEHLRKVARRNMPEQRAAAGGAG
jgi:hypothetical protein